MALGCRPKEVAKRVSESLLARMRASALVDAHAVYQGVTQLADAYLLDDLYLIAESGWVEAARLRPANGGSRNDTVVAGGVPCRSLLIPAALLAQVRYPDLATEIELSEAEAAGATERVGEILDEHTAARAASSRRRLLPSANSTGLLPLDGSRSSGPIRTSPTKPRC